MRMFITSKNKYLLNDMKIFGTCSIPLNTQFPIDIAIKAQHTRTSFDHSVKIW